MKFHLIVPLNRHGNTLCFRKLLLVPIKGEQLLGLDSESGRNVQDVEAAMSS